MCGNLVYGFTVQKHEVKREWSVHICPQMRKFFEQRKLDFPDSKSLMQFCQPSFRRVVVSCFDADLKYCKDDKGCSGRVVPSWNTIFFPFVDHQVFCPSSRKSADLWQWVWNKYGRLCKISNENLVSSDCGSNFACWLMIVSCFR